MTVGYRLEKDLLGEMPVPADAYYCIHSLRARRNFDVSGCKVHPGLLRALAELQGILQ